MLASTLSWGAPTNSPLTNLSASARTLEFAPRKPIESVIKRNEEREFVISNLKALTQAEILRAAKQLAGVLKCDISALLNYPTYAAEVQSDFSEFDLDSDGELSLSEEALRLKRVPTWKQASKPPRLFTTTSHHPVHPTSSSLPTRLCHSP